MTDRPSGSEMIEAERRRQVEKWTPGPWQTMYAPDIRGDDDSRWLVCAVGPRAWTVATIENGAPGDTIATEAATAHLIAAAPTLYDVLNRLSLHGKGEGGAKDTEIAAALRLARGETP